MRQIFSQGALTIAAMVSAGGLVVAGAPQGTAAGRGQQPPSPSVITGRVLDASGNPVGGAFVTALRSDTSGGRPFRPVSARIHATTNGRGEFRLEGLHDGEFFVAALPHNPPVDAGNRLVRSGYGNTFHPGVAAVADARLVRVKPGAPATADITLLPARLSVISGLVLGSNGQPTPGGMVLLAHGDGFFGLDSRAFRIRGDGAFAVAALQPGTYFLQYRETPWPPPRGTIPKVSQAKVMVDGADVTNVRVVPLEMVRATGRVIVDASYRASLVPSTVRVSAFPVPSDGNPGPQHPGNVRDDLTFDFRTWPLPGRVRVTIDSPQWTLKAVRLGGVDITDTTIEFVQGKEITGLEVELVRR